MDARILFAAETDSTKRTDLWSFDPASNQTVDLGIQLPGTDPTAGDVGNSVLFAGLDPVSGSPMLFATDGTVAGTEELALPVTATSGAVTAISDIQFVGGEAFITGSTVDGAQDLWISNGTAAGASFVLPGMDADAITAIGGAFYFAGNPQPATGEAGGTHGLFRSDGTAAGTVRLTPDAADVTPDGIVALANGTILFRALVTTGSTSSETVWVSDGTAAGTHQLLVAGLPGGPAVGAWTPETLASSPGAAIVFEFNPNDAADIVTDTNGDVTRVLNSVNSSEYLTVKTGSDDDPVTIASNSGANGNSSLLRFDPTTISSNSDDPATNWLDAGGVNGTAGAALVDLANSSDLETSGAFTTVIAIDINKSYSYEAGPIWGTLASPGPLQYVQLRWNSASEMAGANLAPASGAATNAQGPITAGWHVMTMIKNGGQLTYRLDGVQVAQVTISSTASLTASDFMIGGGFPQGSGANLGAENGVPAPYVGEFQAYSGVLQGSDLVNAEALAASSIGLTLPSATATTVAAAAPAAVPAGTPSPVLAVNGRAVFTCLDDAGRTGLWVSDGTAAGTVELTGGGSGPKLADAASLLALDSAVLFCGTDANGDFGLWRSDGTQAGTTLVSSLTGTTAGTAPSDLTLFGSKVAFTATDASGLRTLWITDGTKAGTHEILPAGAAAGGVAPTGLGVFYDQLLFTGTDAQGNTGLWMSDGTAAGTHEVSVVAGNSVQTGLLETTLDGGRAISLGSSSTSYAAQDGDTVTGGSGAATVSAASGSVLVQAGPGPLLFLGGTGSSTVAGGSGSVTVLGGSGGGVFSGGSAGNNVLEAGGGNTTLTGGGTGDRLFGSKSGGDVMVAAHGRESLIGGDGSSTITGGATTGAVIFTGGDSTVFGGTAGGDTVVGGSGSLAVGMRGDALFAGSGATYVTGGDSGADSIIGGSGTLAVTGAGDNMLVAGGSGSSSISTGPGASLIFTGPGAMVLNEGGPGTVLLGGGSAEITEGTGAIRYELVKGSAGGTDAVTGFRPGTDGITLFGYGSEAAQWQSAGGNSVLSLSDGTRVTLLGVVETGTLTSV